MLRNIIACRRYDATDNLSKNSLFPNPYSAISIPTKMFNVAFTVGFNGPFVLKKYKNKYYSIKTIR